MSKHRLFYRYSWFWGCVTLFFASVAPAQAGMQSDPGETIQIVQRAISKGDVQMLSKYTGTYTEISILGATTMYSRAQTAYILKAFFRDHPPAQFKFQHRLQVGKDWYVHGRYWDRGRQTPYRLEMNMRWNGRQFEIKSIRILRIE